MDNLESMHKWKNYAELLQRYVIHIYKRNGSAYDPDNVNGGDVRIYDVPALDISSTYIRHSIAAGQSVRYMVPESVYQFLDGSRLYRQ